jgi:molybdenum cofactor guanylyltransferase
VIDRSRRVAAAIIAGGKGRRLGTLDKTALLLGGRSILDRQLQVLRGRFSRVLLVLGHNTPPALPPDLVVLRDRGPSWSGPLAGLDAVLAALTGDEEAAVCLAGDMPFVSGLALEMVRDTAPEAQALVPLCRRQPEPLFARYGKGCAPAIAAALHSGQLKTTAVLASLPVHWLTEASLRAVDPDLRCLENINTPEDLARAESLLAGEPAR